MAVYNLNAAGGTWAEAGLYYCGFLLAIAAVMAVVLRNRPWPSLSQELSMIIAAHALAAVATWRLSAFQSPWLICAVGLPLSICGMKPLRRFMPGIQLQLVTALMGMVFGLGWSLTFISALDIHPTTRALFYTSLGLGLLGIAVGFGRLWQIAIILGRRSWCRPHGPLPPQPDGRCPKVSVHVPCYAEPPDVVSATLRALSRLDYPDYEVLVIDNNTKDPALWHPIETLCRQLGPRFRFFHVDPLAGAKAGALNFALTRTSANATLVACVDADYVAEPDFLRRLVGFFDDPRMGFVQTSHDYRDWQESIYGSACYWEYMLACKQEVPALNEFCASYSVGTMCLYPRRVLEEVGGWAEWCLSEDSEIAIRIHALGYSSVTMPDTFGRGLIPERFADYKKQRFRWTAGPVQQLKRHLPVLLPNILGRRTRMTAAQKFYEFLHCGAGISILAGLLVLPLQLALLLSILGHGDFIPVPHVLWVLLALGVPSGLAFGWLRFARLGGGIKAMLLAPLALASLSHVKDLAVLATFFSSRPLTWTRTNKFSPTPDRPAALWNTKWEMVRGAAMVGVGIVLAPFAHYSQPDVIFIGVIGSMLSGLTYFIAPAMALLGERAIRRSSERQQPSEPARDEVTRRGYSSDEHTLGKPTTVKPVS